MHCTLQGTYNNSKRFNNLSNKHVCGDSLKIGINGGTNFFLCAQGRLRIYLLSKGRH